MYVRILYCVLCAQWQRQQRAAEHGAAAHAGAADPDGGVRRLPQPPDPEPAPRAADPRAPQSALTAGLKIYSP